MTAACMFAQGVRHEAKRGARPNRSTRRCHYVAVFLQFVAHVQFVCGRDDLHLARERLGMHGHAHRTQVLFKKKYTHTRTTTNRLDLQPNGSFPDMTMLQ